MSSLFQILAIVGAVGAGTAAGAFFTFSTFTIRGLQRLPPAQGAAAMQAINEEAPTPSFMLLLFGTGAVCLALAIYTVSRLEEPRSRVQLAACLLYLIGVVVMTMGYHVPRNNVLAALDPNSAEGVAYWAIYLKEWVRMNHVRTVAPLLTAVLLTISLRMD